MPTITPRLLLLVPATLVFVVTTVVVGLVAPVPWPWLVGIVVGVAVAALVANLLDRRAPDVALARLGARPIPDGAEPRLESLVESICASNGIAEPDLYVVDSRSPDAAVAGHPGDTRLVVTTGALRQYDRLELEAVVARELVQFGEGVHAATLLAALAPWYGPFASALRRRLVDDRRLARLDVDGVMVTRYPPALASAFEKSARADGVDDAGPTAHLWLIGPRRGDAAVQPDLTERIDTLREL